MAEGGGGQKEAILHSTQGESSGNTGGRLHDTREHWIDRAAYEKFRVPLENLQHPTIRQYVGLFTDSYALWENAEAAVRGMRWGANQENARRLAEAEVHGNTGSWEELRASYPVRLLRAKKLTTETMQCLEYGFGGLPLFSEEIQHAVEPYGCTARESADGGDDDEPRVTPGSVWRNREEVQETREFIPSGETPSTNYLWRNHARLDPIPHFEEIAERLGIPRPYWQDPETRQYISLMSDSEDIINALREGERAPGAPGLRPPVAERYRAAAGLLQFTVATLQEGFQGRTVTPDFVQETLAPLASFGIEVVKVPPRQKLLPQPNGNS